MHQILGAEPRSRLHVLTLWVFVAFVLGGSTFSCLGMKCCTGYIPQCCSLYHTTLYMPFICILTHCYRVYVLQSIVFCELLVHGWLHKCSVNMESNNKCTWPHLISLSLSFRENVFFSTAINIDVVIIIIDIAITLLLPNLIATENKNPKSRKMVNRWSR